MYFGVYVSHRVAQQGARVEVGEIYINAFRRAINSSRSKSCVA
jgi:hypothetical protein